MNALQLTEVAKRYADADEVVRAVDGVSLGIEPGKTIALYGPSGSGKTTLLLLSAGLLAPDAGTVAVAGTDLASLNTNRLIDLQRKTIGFIYQSPHLLSGVPAVENAAVKLLADGRSLRSARPVACDWLERVGLAHRLRHTPEQLSGGERQRVAIARALANDPQLILADEPTGNLDSQRGRELLELLAEIARENGAAVLLATHDPRAADIADEVFALRDGKLLAGSDGAAPADLLESQQHLG
ncbi:MAG TPA: ABC transporter ATP-binding protein [Solirubrobacteraceae bacterium]|jgi:putative ABC transport system ATP-binding protein|nr:ABC transporter ATP-binding protein [Solirubrobacteraceae bacterium]